jgi:hypothetical protein
MVWKTKDLPDYLRKERGALVTSICNRRHLRSEKASINHKRIRMTAKDKCINYVEFKAKANRELFVFEKVKGLWKIARYMFNKTEPK